nr:hypothetical protein [Ruminococcus bromii]
MNKRLREISVSIKDLKKKIPTADDDLNIRIHWDNDFTFEVKIPLNKKYNKRR